MYKFYFKYILAHKYYIVFLSFIIFFTLIFSSIDPLIFTILLDYIIPDKNTSLLLVLIVCYIMIIILRSLLKLCQTYIYNFISIKILYKLKSDLFRKIQDVDLSFFRKYDKGDIISRMETDIHTVQYFTTTLLLGIITDAGVLIVSLTAAAFINLKLLLIMIPFIPIFYYFTDKSGIKLTKLTRNVREQSAKILSFIEKTISGIATIKDNVSENKRTKQFIGLSRDITEVTINRGFLAGIINISIEAFSISLPVILLFIGAYSVINDELTAGLLVAYYTYLLRVFQPINRLSRLNVTFKNVKVSMERIYDLFSYENKIIESKHAIQKRYFDCVIKFKSITFSYDGETNILKNFNLSIHKGEKIALTGLSGSGKSTIINLLLRHYDTYNGVIEIDGIDIKSISLKSFRKLFGRISQNETLIFNDVINNILFYNEKTDNSKLEDYAKDLGIDHLLSDDNRCVNDSSLSKGEVQRIAILRELLKENQILILDEATSNLDLHNEKIVIDKVLEYFKDKTVIFIAHRLSSVKFADRIIHLEDGSITEAGTHNELMNKKGKYYKLWTIQNI